MGRKVLVSVDGAVNVDVVTTGAPLPVQLVDESSLLPAGATSFVFRPGGAAAPGVFTTPAALKAGLLSVDLAADKVIVVDDTLAPAHLTAVDSPWPLNNATFESASPIAILILDAGCIFSQDTIHVRARDIEIEIAAASAATIWTPSVVPGAFFILDSAIVANASVTPWIEVAGGLALGIVMSGTSRLTTGLQAKIEAGGTVDVGVFSGSTVAPNSFVHGVAPGGALAFTVDGSSQALVSTVQDNANLVVTTTVLDPVTTFFFQPGGVAGGNVYTTPDSVLASMELTPGPKVLVVDSSLGAAHLTAGTFNLLGGLTLKAAIPFASVLHVDDGSKWNVSTLVISEVLTVINDAGASGPVITSAGNNVAIYVTSDSTLQSSGATAFAQKSAGGGFFFLRAAGATIGGGAHPVVAIDALQTVFGQFIDSGTLAPSAVIGAGTLSAAQDSGSAVNAQPGLGTLTKILADVAEQIAFLAGAAANWSTPTPTQVKDALDRLAAPNSAAGNGNAGTGTASLSVTTAATITKAKNGKMRVRASALISTSAAATLTIALTRDATPIGTNKTLVAGAALGGLDAGIEFIDTAPDGAAHNYTCTWTVTAGTITCAANSAQLSVLEDS